jgi:hypothetical protein
MTPSPFRFRATPKAEKSLTNDHVCCFPELVNFLFVIPQRFRRPNPAAFNGSSLFLGNFNSMNQIRVDNAISGNDEPARNGNTSTVGLVVQTSKGSLASRLRDAAATPGQGSQGAGRVLYGLRDDDTGKLINW